MSSSSRSIVDQITTATDKRFEAVAHMADAIVELTLENGDCLPVDMHMVGYSEKDVAALWHFAQAIAAIELKHMESNAPSFSLKEVRYA